MIVVDENLHSRSIMAMISAWYKGQIVSIASLRPGSVIKDDAIPALLLTVRQPTFITINDSDFWLKIAAHPAYCVVTAPLPKERIRELPGLLRLSLQQPEFWTKALRMGKVLRLTDSQITFYEADRLIRQVDWR
jgi:hypothetical protein